MSDSARIISDSARTSRTRSKAERGRELLSVVYECAELYHAAKERDRDRARERYFRALDRFNNFVLHGTDHDEA
jgi:hypothetical protein